MLSPRRMELSTSHFTAWSAANTTSAMEVAAASAGRREILCAVPLFTGDPDPSTPRSGIGRRRALHVRREAREGDRRQEALEPLDAETRRLYGGDCVAVRVTAAHEAHPERLDAVLPAGGPALGAHVLDKEQPPIRAEDAPDLAQSRPLIGDRAQHERRDHRVEARVREGQLLGPCLGDLYGEGDRLQPGPQPPPHEGVGLDDNQPRDVAVVGEVRPGPAAYLQHLAPRRGEQARPALAHPGALHRGAHPVVEGREDAVSLAQAVLPPVAGSPGSPAVCHRRPCPATPFGPRGPPRLGPRSDAVAGARAYL